MSKLSFANKDVTPPDGYRYTVAETGFTVRDITYSGWVGKARAHMTANGIPIPLDLEQQMTDQLCTQLEPEWCGRSNDQPWINTRFGLGQVKDWLFAHMKLAIHGFVEQEEADRRARICVSCPHNVETAGCGSHCAKLGQLLTNEIAQKTTKYDQDLKACAVCYCLNTVQIHFPLSILEGSDTTEKQSLYPSFCWKQRSGENYLNAGQETQDG